jgi:Holliday junction DNA helicase RuvA
VLELRDKLPAATGLARVETSPARDEVVSALLALGYNDREAQAAVKELPAELALADAIRQALKHLAKP